MRMVPEAPPTDLRRLNADGRPFKAERLNGRLAMLGVIAERLNGRLAMLGVIAAIGAYAVTGQLIPGLW
jgi:hypothetical protein